MATALPEGVSSADFDQAIREIRKIVGDEWVFLDTDLSPYLDHMSAVPPEYRMPSAALAPANVEETQAILKIANRFSLPLWTFGNGKNWAYGGPTPLHAGYLCLDLKRMNRILEVNDDSGYVLVEPGVSYFQLYQHLQDIGSNLWIDCAAPGWGGVIGNALEHGAGYTPYADHYVMSCGMEVLLADGSLVRTGMGAMPGSKAWQQFKYGYGPSLDGMFTQGNFGIVTKMGFWMMPKPPVYKPFMFSYENESDLHGIMEVLRPLKLNMVWQNGAVGEHIGYSASVLGPRSDYTNNRAPITAARWKEVAHDLNLGIWNFYGACYGLPANVEMQFGALKGAMTSIPGAKVWLEGDREPNDAGWNYRAKLMQGIPNLTEFNLVNWDGGGHLNFSPMGPMGGDHAVKLYDMMKAVTNGHGFDHLTEIVGTFRGFIALTMVMFDPRDEETAKRADACAVDIIQKSAAAGYGELKANLRYMNTVMGSYTGNDSGLHKVNQKIKDALDPQGVLSPGKSDIWPSSWQHSRAN